MAKVKFSAGITEIYGRLGDYVFRRSPTGKVFISKSPDMSHVQWSEAQQAHRQRFKQAVDFAKAAMADPVTGPLYREAARQQNKRPYDLAISDFFKDQDLQQK
jgi:hypothetical protein